MGNIVIGTIVFGLLSLAVFNLVKKGKDKSSTCGCGCSSCPSAKSCHK